MGNPSFTTLFHAKKSPLYLATICPVSVLSLLVVELLNELESFVSTISFCPGTVNICSLIGGSSNGVRNGIDKFHPCAL